MPHSHKVVAFFAFFANYYDDESSDSLSTCSSSTSAEDDEAEYVSDRELEVLYAILMVGETRGAIELKEKLTDYVDRVIPGYNKHEFKQHFRMYPETFEAVLSILGPGLSRTTVASGRKPIPAEKQLLIALWFMATPDSYRSICVKFGVGKATAFRAVRRVSYALHCVAPRFIQWPKEQRAVRVIEEFAVVRGFPKVVGAVDGTHIRIRAPKEDAGSYINRKGHHSIILQAVCDSRSMFTHCYARHVGSVHDARVFRNSPLAQFIQMPEEYFFNDSHIIGDVAYAIHPHVMVPFPDNRHLTMRQRNFNFCLSSTRMAIERTFGLLKVRFRILLDCLPLTDLKRVPEFIIDCCVLHNICVLNNDLMNVQILPRDNNEHIHAGGPGARLGEAKRNNIMNNLRQRLH